MKKLISILLAAASLMLAGCANPRVQNAGIGTVMGGAVGALLGDSSKAARIGAGLGLLVGAALPVQGTQAYTQQPGAYPPPGASCPSDAQLVPVNGQWLCQHNQPQPYPQPGNGQQGGSYPPPGASCPPGAQLVRMHGQWICQHGWPQQYPGGFPFPQPNQSHHGQSYTQQPYMACGAAAMQMTCPSIGLPNGCRRCQ